LDPSSNNLQVMTNYSHHFFDVWKSHFISYNLLLLFLKTKITWQIREDNKKGVYVENIKEVETANARDVIQLLVQVCNASTYTLEYCFSTLTEWLYDPCFLVF
jgi:hypothetical protein